MGMKQALPPLAEPLRWTLIAIAGLWLGLALSGPINAHSTPKPLGNDDAEFVFAGLCPNGETYRLFAYTHIVNGQGISKYDYEGPAGKGTIRSNTTPRTLAVRVCRQLAEIIDDH